MEHYLTKEKLPTVFISIFLVAVGILFLRLPIFFTDSDLWYHLSGGRYFFEHGSPPSEGYFSFISPPKQWHDYYWFFQVIVYAAYSAASYHGIIILRAALFALTLFFIWKNIQRKGQLSIPHLSIISVLFVLILFAILPRGTITRPHIFSYFFIVVFIYLFEYRKAMLWCLPILAILWVNIHGIEYPVMFLIIGAYSLDILIDRWRSHKKYSDLGRTHRCCVIGALYCVFLTPHGLDLLSVPFDIATLQERYIAELHTLSLQRLVTWIFWPPLAFIRSAAHILIAAAFVSVLMLTIRKRISVAHLVLFVGALGLLVRANRFTYEFILLSLPFLRDGSGMLLDREIRFKFKWAPHAFLGGVTSAGLVLLFVTVPINHKYPFSKAGLPCGVVRFLNHLNVGGEVMNPPNTGGYWQWAVSPNYRIFMDLQMALFSSDDYFLNRNFYHDPAVMNRFMKKYNPSFVSAPLGETTQLNDVDTFVPVFVDNAEILYVNRTKHSEIAMEFGFKHFNPEKLNNINYKTLDEKALHDLKTEAERIRSIDQMNLVANLLLGNICLRKGKFSLAGRYADLLLAEFPGNYSGYFVKGTALYKEGRIEEALPWLKKAADVQGTEGRNLVKDALYKCYVDLKQFRKGYQLLYRTIDPYSPKTTHEDLYKLGVAAASAGKVREAEHFLKCAALKVPPERKDDLKKIHLLLKELQP